MDQNLSIEKIQKLNPTLLEIYSDTIWESIKILKGIISESIFLVYLGRYIQNYESLTYVFKSKKEDKYICIKVCGRYDDWDMPKDVKNLIEYIDKTDFVFFNRSTQKIILAGETTDTINLGNAEFQRKGRTIASAKKKFPFIYKTIGTKTDDSSLSLNERIEGKIGQPRSISALSIFLHFILSIRYKIPSLISIMPNIESDEKKGFKINERSENYFFNYLSLIVLNQISNAKKQLILYEKKIYKESLRFLKNPKLLDRITAEPIKSIFYQKQSLFYKSFLQYMYGNTSNMSEILNLTNWNFDSFSLWKNSDLTKEKSKIINRKNYFFKKVINNSFIKSYSYNKYKARVGFIKDTSKLIEILSNIPNASIDKKKLEKKLNSSLPTLIIPTLAFQWETKTKIIPKVDPGTGEICNFAEMFAYDISGSKKANILLYFYVKPSDDFSNTNKLFKAAKIYQDCMIIDDKIYDY